MRQWWHGIGVVAVVVFAGLGSVAEATNRTEITSARLVFDNVRRVAVFDENVVVTDPGMRIECDKLTVVFDENRQADSATAVGRVKFVESDRVGRADRAVYSAKTGVLVLSGNATVQRGKETLSGTRIELSRFDNTVTCTQARLVLYPDDGKGFRMGMPE